MNVLELRGVTKHFGALLVTDDVSLEIVEGEIHALIGPNGAGKTTLISEVLGELLPDAGSVFFEGSEVTSLRETARARLGIARSFQIAALCLSLTVLENVVLAVNAHNGHNFHFWRPAFSEEPTMEAATEALRTVGLEGLKHEMAGNIAHGQQRRLDIAMAIATKPKLLLLDEPLAGLGAGEAAEMAKYIGTLRERYSVLLVEHDMDVVFSVADRISVLDCGRCIATGDAETIRRDPNVRRAYLGNDYE